MAGIKGYGFEINSRYYISKLKARRIPQLSMKTAADRLSSALSSETRPQNNVVIIYRVMDVTERGKRKGQEWCFRIPADK